MAYKNACNDGQNNIRPPCVALIVDDPTYDAGQNEGIAARLARPTRVSGKDGQVVGIQIVYGNVLEEIDKAEARDKPLLVYSWLPRAEVMRPGRFARITLASFYHCGPGDSSSPLAVAIDFEVDACDYPIEHVEKAVVWRLQQPSSTKAALFVNKFNLSADQLLELLGIGDDLDLARNSTPSAAQLDEAACRWLNDNTDAWEAWLPAFELYTTPLYQWDVWIIVCGVVSALGGMIISTVVRRSKKTKDEIEAAKDLSSVWPDEQPEAPTHWIISFSYCSCKLTNSEEWDPVIKYLSNALRCMVTAKFGNRLVFFTLGQLFVAVCTGFLEGLVYSSWLKYGLNQLSLEVTISCAVLMLTLKLVEWGLGRLPSGEQIVQRQLQKKLLNQYQMVLKPIIIDHETRVYCWEQFQKAIESTASELASGCYIAAFSVVLDFTGFLSALAFLFYYMFKDGIPKDVSYLTIAAIVCAPVWLAIVLLIGPLAKRPSIICCAKAKVKEKKSTNHTTTDGRGAGGGGGGGFAEFVPSMTDCKTAYGGILWTCVYLLWAFAPILINPLKNDLGPGTNSIPLEDLLTASKRHAAYI
jgi:hypothetical protein